VSQVNIDNPLVAIWQIDATAIFGSRGEVRVTSNFLALFSVSTA
jgi:hypothetical protein